MYKTSNQVYGSGVITRNRVQQDIMRIGIENIGNTCYINAMLQCLINTPAINNILKGVNDKKKNTDLFKQFYIIWFRIQSGMEPEHDEVVQFKKLMNQHKDFDNLNQQDCIEFFHVFLDIVNTPQLSQVFNGQFTHQFTCENCQNTNKQNESFINISLFINKDYCNINQLLKDYFKQEQVQSQENCKKCNKKYPIKKTTNITNTPQILVIQLKRYDQRQIKQNYNVIIEQQITFLNQYKLYAFINHQGFSIYNGHYTCLIRSQNGWYNFNDQRVSEYSNKIVDEELSKSQNSYVLFYQRQ